MSFGYITKQHSYPMDIKAPVWIKNYDGIGVYKWYYISAQSPSSIGSTYLYEFIQIELN